MDFIQRTKLDREKYFKSQKILFDKHISQILNWKSNCPLENFPTFLKPKKCWFSIQLSWKFKAHYEPLAARPEKL